MNIFSNETNFLLKMGAITSSQKVTYLISKVHLRNRKNQP